MNTTKIKRISQCTETETLNGVKVIVVPPHIKAGAFTREVSKAASTPEEALNSLRDYQGDVIVKQVVHYEKQPSGEFQKIIRWQCFGKTIHSGYDYNTLNGGRRAVRKPSGTARIYYQPSQN